MWVKMSCSRFYSGRIIKVPIWGKQTSGVFCIPFMAKKLTFSVFPLIPFNVSGWEEMHGRGERLEEGGGGEADGRVYRREELKCNEN